MKYLDEKKPPIGRTIIISEYNSKLKKGVPETGGEGPLFMLHRFLKGVWSKY